MLTSPLCRAFGADQAQWWRENRAISARFWCATRAKRPQNVRAIAASALQKLRKIGKSFARVRRGFAARLALRKRGFGVKIARFRCDFAARRAQNDRKTCARPPRARCKIRARSTRVFFFSNHESFVSWHFLTPPVMSNKGLGFLVYGV